MESVKNSESVANGENAAQIALDAVKTEYDHCILRSERLDNKIYILLSICAFLFAFSMSSINKLGTLSMPQSIRDLIFIVMYIMITLVNTGMFIYLIYQLVKLLKGEKIKRLDAKDVLMGDLFSLPPKQAARVIGHIYLDAMTENNINIEERFLIFNKCTQLLFFIVLFSIIEKFIENFM